MKKINIFNPGSPLFPFRKLAMVTILLAALIVFHNLTARRMFVFSDNEQWSSKGAGYHK